MADREIITNVELLGEIKKLREQLLLMNEKFVNVEERINTTNNILVEHIGFINQVFETIKKPLFFVMNKLNTVFQLENV